MKKLIYIAAMILTVYLGIMYEWQESTWLLSAEIVFPVLCKLTAWLIGRKLDIKAELYKDVAERGEALPVKICVSNGGSLPAIVKLVISCKYVAGNEKKDEKIDMHISPKKTVYPEVHIPAKYCGRLLLTVQKIRVFDCWGFCSVHKKQSFTTEVTVMPKPYPVNLTVSNKTKWFPIDGESYAKDRGGDDTAEIYEVREYRAGDRMQKVHWKLSAKEDELYIKEFSYPLGAAVVVLLEAGQGKEVMESFMEAVVSVSTALIRMECPHYVVWRKRTEKQIRRILLRDEEEFYGFLMELMEFENGSLETNIVEYYRHEYKSDTYSTLLTLRTDLTIQLNQEESMDMKVQGIEAFFEQAALIV